MMFVISPLLALIALVTVPLSVVVTREDRQALAAAVRRAVEAHRRAQRADRGGVHRARAGEGVRPAAARSRRRSRRRTSELYRGQLPRAVHVRDRSCRRSMFIGNLNYVAIAVVGGLRVASGAMRSATCRRSSSTRGSSRSRSRQLASMANLLQSGVASAERVFELLDAEEQSPDPVRRRRRRRLRGEVAFEDVAFRYKPDAAADRGPVAGRRAGPDGRDRRPDRRRQDDAREPADAVLRARRRQRSCSTASTSRRCARDDLRSQIGMVLQDTWLFGGTIRDNIAYGRPERDRGGDLAAAQGDATSTGSCARCPTATTR